MPDVSHVELCFVTCGEIIYLSDMVSNFMFLHCYTDRKACTTYPQKFCSRTNEGKKNKNPCLAGKQMLKWRY